MRAYDPATGLYKDQSIGDTPKAYTIDVDGKPTRVVGVGCKNGGFYVFDAATGKLSAPHARLHRPAGRAAEPSADRRMLALPGADRRPADRLRHRRQGDLHQRHRPPLMASAADPKDRWHPPTGGRVVSISLDTRTENWRHERPKVAAVGGTKAKPAFTDVGDPVASGIALANGVAYFTTTVSGKLVALDTADGQAAQGDRPRPGLVRPVGVARPGLRRHGQHAVRAVDAKEAYFPKRLTGTLYSFGLPGEDEVDRMGAGGRVTKGALLPSLSRFAFLLEALSPSLGQFPGVVGPWHDRGLNRLPARWLSEAKKCWMVCRGRTRPAVVRPARGAAFVQNSHPCPEAGRGGRKALAL